MTLGNLVWHDVNNDGLVGVDEKGIRGVAVQLFREGDDPATAIPVATDLTDNNGGYLFENLLPGRYFVYIPLPPQQYPMSSTSTDGVDNGEDNDDNSDQPGGKGASVYSPVIELAPGAEPLNDGNDANGDLTIDFGFFAPASLGDLVWLDNDRDGVQDRNETGRPGTTDERGVPGVLVTLYDALTNSIVATTTTNTHGRYLFDDLLPGSYFVEFTVPQEYSLSPADQGGNDAFDSDVNAATLRTPPTTLQSGGHDPTLDMGLYLPIQPAAIGDRVWFDQDKDGIQDNSEKGVPGVTVELHTATGNLVATAITDAQGYYQFNSLPPGDYYLLFTAPAGYTITNIDQGSNDAQDSDVDPNTGRTLVTTLVAGEQDMTWDLGLYLPTEPASIGDIVWFDTDADGVQDVNETGVPGVQVTLYTANGQLIATTTTNADGYYEFDNLPPGNYYLIFDAPAGYFPTLPNQGSDDALDSDANPADGRTAVTQLDAGEHDMTWDYGLYLLDTETGNLLPPASIGDFVWNDTDEDGVQDVGETGMPSVTVKLYDGDGVLIAIDVTDVNGHYNFPNLPPGQYYIEVVTPDGYVISPVNNTTMDDIHDSDINADTGRTEVSTVNNGESLPDLDAGIYRPKPTNLDEEDEPGAAQDKQLYLPVVARKNFKNAPSSYAIVICGVQACIAP